VGPARRVGALCLAAGALAPATQAATNPIQSENARPATAGWTPVAETTSIEGYAGRTNVAPGETIAFHVAAAAPGARYRLLVFRLGWYSAGGARLAACVPACDADRAALFPRPPPAYDPATG
jgi:hypothetical protein